MSNFKKKLSQNDNLLFGHYSKQNTLINIIVSKDLLIIDATADAFALFNQPKEKILNSSILEQFLKLDTTFKFNLNENSSSHLNIKKKKLNVNVTEFSTCFLISISSIDNLFNLLRLYITSIINNLPGAVYWKDLDGRYMGCNKFVANMAGYDNPEDMIGKTDYDLCWKDFADEWRLLDKKVLVENKTLVREEHAKLADGKIITELTFKTPLKNEYNQSIGIIGTSLDITELKETEEKLAIAKEAAEAANHAKTEFIANMSHDIRTPLSGVVGLGSIVEQEISDPTIKSKVHDMVKSAEELLNMLNEILDVVSMDNISASDIQSEPFNLQHLVQTIIDLEQSSVDLKNIQLRQNIDNKIPAMLIGDHKKIHHILLNLVGNAIKFTQKGHISIDIKLSKRFKNKVELLFTVTDTGIGIPKDSLDKVFELFYKVTPSYKGLDKGHGVGLHIVKTYTELLGGKLDIESEPDKGSKFSFTLTLQIADKNINLPSINSDSKPLSTATSRNFECDKTINILLIEDNDIARMVAKTVLEENKGIVHDVPDAESGLEIGKTNNFDIILTDIGLPGMSGIEFAQQFRNFEKQNNKISIPIIALTGHAEGKLRSECINAGINKVIIKPIRPDIINDIFRSLSLSKETSAKDTLTNAELDLPENDLELFNLENEMIFDIEKAKSILGQNNTELLMTLLKDTINKDIPKELPKLKAAHAINDWQTIANITHKLKGGFVSIGLNQAATACKYLERYHKTGKTELLEKLYQQVLNTIDVTVNRLIPFIK